MIDTPDRGEPPVAAFEQMQHGANGTRCVLGCRYFGRPQRDFPRQYLRHSKVEQSEYGGDGKTRGQQPPLLRAEQA
jgi:hypothetical protein